VTWLLSLGVFGTLLACGWALVERLKRAASDGRLKVLVVELEGARAHVGRLEAMVADLRADAASARVASLEERHRLEALAIQLKRDAALAWEAWRACAENGSPPGDVGVLLKRMLETPLGADVGGAAEVPATASAVVVPDSSTT
jgi:hypothetical protein